MAMDIMFSYSLLVRSGIAILLCSQVAVGIDGGLGRFFMEDHMIKAAAGLNFQSKPGDHILRVYPRLRFNCCGAISSVTVVGQSLDSNNFGLELYLWEPQLLTSPTPTSSFDNGCSVDDGDDEGNADSCIPRYSHKLNYTLTNKTNIIQLKITGDANFRAWTFLGIRHSEDITLLYGSGENGRPSYIASEGKTCIPRNDGNNGDLDYPLISVQLVCNTRCVGPCTSSEFLPISNQLFRRDETTIFPDFNFTSSGSVFSWQFAAIERPGSNISMPHIQIWRPCQMHENLQTDADMVPCYNLIHSTSRQNVKPQMDERNIYTYQLDSEMQVRAGDVVGVQQPQDSRLLLALHGEISSSFVTGFNSTVTSVNTRQVMQPLPLLRPASTATAMPSSQSHPTLTTNTPSSGPSAELSDKRSMQPTVQTPSRPPTRPSVQPTVLVPSRPPDERSVQPTVQNPSSPPTAAQNDVPALAIVGAGGGVTVAGLLVAVLAVLACILWKKRRRGHRNKQSTSSGLQPQNSIPGNNPVYHAPINDNLAEPFYIEPISRRGNSELYETIQVAQMYEVPSTSLSPERKESDIQNEHTYHVLDTAMTQGRGSEVDNDTDTYHILEPIPVANQRGHEYQELEGPTDPTNTETGQHHFSSHDRLYHILENGRPGGGTEDYELYVPNMDQRKTLQNSTTGQHLSSSDIYGSLRETQLRSTSVSPASTMSLQFFEECPSFWQPGSTTESLYQQLASRKFREICRHQIQTTEHLGSGQFGTVKKGIWQASKGNKEVAVKMLQPNPTGEDTVRFLQEAAIMGQFRHPNIVQLMGVVTVDKPLMIVLELLSNGDLNTYLNKNRPPAGESPGPEWPGMLLGFCQHVAAGIDYLSTKGFVHRDLAARNILLSKDRICKISDFGMSRDLQNENYYITRGGEIPVKWTAPETLNYKKYSTASDVWSYGVVMYEIWSLGHKPFEGYTNPEAVKLVDGGCRLAPPPGCPRELYRLMIQCWHPTASERPSTSELLKELTKKESSLLQWREEDSQCHPQASLLGAELSVGKDLYTELQNTYLQQ